MEVMPALNKIYRPTYGQWKKITDYTDFCPNDTFQYSNMELIDFNKCKIHLKGGKRIPFDGLSEHQFIWACNGGYYEEAPLINDKERI